MQTTTYRISEALRRIKDKSLTIPQFQRSFIWQDSQVKLLVDSIARNYPIGSILLLEKSQELQLYSRGIEAIIREGFPPDEILGTPQETNLEAHYVLDGQQRLTSIARVLLNAHPKQAYYFDLKCMLTDFEKEENNWVLSRRRGKNGETPDRKDKGRLLRSDIVLDPTKVEVFVSEYLEDSEDNPELKEDRTKRLEAAAKIKSIFETIRNYRIPAVILERDAPVESICRIFETINSTGTRLKTFDLAVAKYFQKELDLRDLWDRTLNQFPILKDFEVDGERLLQTMVLIRAGKEGKYAEPTRSALLKLESNFLKSVWESSARTLADTYEWAKGQGARNSTLPNHGVLVAIAAMRTIETDFNTVSTEPILRRWYFCKVLQQGSRQAANYRIGQDFSALLRYVKTSVPPEFLKVELSKNALINLKSAADVRYRAIQMLMATTIQRDLITGKMINADSEIQDHHIFPRRLAKSHNLTKPSLDSILNRIPILATSNRDLSDQEPLEYFSELLDQARNSGTMGDLKRRLADAMIPGDPDSSDWIDQFRLTNIQEFFGNRSLLLLDRIREIIGDSLFNTDPPSDDEVEDD